MSVPVCKNKLSSKELVTAKQFAKTFGHENVFEKLNPCHPN